MTEDKEPKENEKPDGKGADDSADPEGKGGNPPAGSGGNGSDDDEKFRQMVREELAKILPSGDRANIPASRRVDIEAQAEEMVRRATEKLKLETEVTDLRKQVADAAKKGVEVVEDAPKKVRRLTKVLWGDK